MHGGRNLAGGYIDNLKIHIFSKKESSSMAIDASSIDGVPDDFVLPPLEGLDFTDTRNYTNQIWAVNITMSTAVTISLLLRMYSRLFIAKQFKIEDCKYISLDSLLDL